MRIHTVESGDTIWKIARKYSTPAPKIIEANALSDPERLFIGQKLMIFTPTRTYTVKGGDTLEKIALRFGVRTDSLLAGNPSLMGEEKIYPGQILAVKYDSPRYGTGASNGYFYKGCPIERLRLVLPYLTYVTIASHIFDGKILKEIFPYQKALKAISENGKCAVMRIYSEIDGEKLELTKEMLTEEAIKCAKDSSFGAVSFILPNISSSSKLYRDFLLYAKRKLMEFDLLLFAEIDGNGAWQNSGISEIADVSILNYQKIPLNDVPSFNEGEKKLLFDFADDGECQKTLLDINSQAYANGAAIELSDAFSALKKSGSHVFFDEDRLICFFHFKKYTGGVGHDIEICYESPENENAKLALLGELGYLGVSFDIGRVPPSSLMLFYTCFSAGQNLYYGKRPNS